MGLVAHSSNSVSEKVLGAAIEVHRCLGPGLLESSYHACLCRELELRNISFHSQLVLPLKYKGMEIPKAYVIDLLVENALVVEIKIVDKLLPIHSAQLRTYMRLRDVAAGLLLNFKATQLSQGIRRILH
jgi:GxxExxY protein